MSDRTFVKTFIISACVMLLLIGGAVVVLDPFYHYHAPFFGLKTVLTESEYQGIGSVRNLDYDAILLGSSMAENNNNRWFDEAFSCTTIKGIKSSATIPDLMYLLDNAMEEHELKYVFMNLDLFSFGEDPNLTFVDKNASIPKYLYNKNPFDDVQYLYNKDVLFKKLPVNFVKSLSDSYDEGESYNWWYDKEFSEEAVKRNSPLPCEDKSGNQLPVDDEYMNLVEANMRSITERIEANPETVFIMFIPPYSDYFWESTRMDGLEDRYRYVLNVVPKALSSYDNSICHDFTGEEEITSNLDNYMDAMHFKPEINKWIVDEISGN